MSNDPTQTEFVSRDLLGQKVADQLRRKILKGQLPAGTRLVEVDVATQFGTSRGPVRHAFSLLARDRLLEAIPGRGTYVRGLTEEDVRQIYGVRKVLENYAIDLAVQRTTEQDWQKVKETAIRMEEAAKARDFKDCIRLDATVHRQIWELSGNERLIPMLELILSPCLDMIELNAETDDDWTETARNHLVLVESLVARDVDAAKANLSKQLEGSLELALSASKASTKVLAKSDTNSR